MRGIALQPRHPHVFLAALLALTLPLAGCTGPGPDAGAASLDPDLHASLDGLTHTERDVAAGWSVRTVDDEALSLSDLEGKVVLIEFMGAGCSACLANLPHHKQLWERFGADPDFAFVALNVWNENDDILRDYRDKHAIEWPMAMSPDGARAAYEVRGTPTHWFIDHEGRTHSRGSFLSLESMEAEVSYLLDQVPGRTGSGARDADAGVAGDAGTAGTVPDDAPADGDAQGGDAADPDAHAALDVEHYEAGTPAPDFTVTTIDNESYRLSDFKGKVVLLEFMAAGCGACNANLPHHQDMWETYGANEDFVFLALATWPHETEDELREYRDDKQLEWSIAKDHDRTVSEAYDVAGTPRHRFIDHEGNLHSADGYMVFEDMKTEIDHLLAALSA